MKIVPSNRLKSPNYTKVYNNKRHNSKVLDYSPSLTGNIYIWMDRTRSYNGGFLPFLNKEYLKRYVAKNFSLGNIKQTERNSITALKSYFDINPLGFKAFSMTFDLSNYENLTNKDIEESIVDDIKKWHAGALDRFQIKNDSSPIDKGLDEYGITTNDFKI
tara:strand:+ start:93 stop:575 length:483 start_codon:yes stop_codon:yes gene_type:complete